MRKPTFLGHDRPLLTDMVLTATPEEFSQHVRTGVYDGADAFGMQPTAMRAVRDNLDLVPFRA